ncbi:MAG: shikimate kinase, partial [Candidatus Limnocylindrales bacterium]
MDVVLVGLPGSGKSVVGKRVANRHGATFVDLDERIERADGRPIPRIFEEDGEAAFRTLERQAVADLGPADADPQVRRVVATGGGAIVDPRNRWALYRGRLSVWLDSRPEVLAQRLRRSPHVRPLVTMRDPIGTIRDLAARRERFYAAADLHIAGVAEVSAVVNAIEAQLAAGGPSATRSTTLVRATTPIGRIVIGEGVMTDAVDGALRRLEARRAVLVSEPGAWAAVGTGLAASLQAAGWTIVTVILPEGEAAKRLTVLEGA